MRSSGHPVQRWNVSSPLPCEEHFNLIGISSSGESILAFLLAFLFSFISVQSTGDTDINPTTVVAKSSQIVFGGLSKGRGEGEASAQRMNLVAGAVAGCAAGQATDMTGDLKTGHLLGAKPNVQFAAQLFGATIALFLAPGLFILFAIASPCITTGTQPCTYSAPSAAAWVAVAKVHINLTPLHSVLICFPGCHCPQASHPPFLWVHCHRPLNTRRYCRDREAPMDP